MAINGGLGLGGREGGLCLMMVDGEKIVLKF